MSGPPRIRAIDVAKEAGVSSATVSYVLNNTPGQKISDATAQRVRDAARRLGYVSNPAAQALARGSSKLVIVDVSDFYALEMGSLMGRHVLRMLEELGFDAIQTWWPGGGGHPERHERLVRIVRATNPRAVFSVLPLPPDLRADLEKVGRQSYPSAAESPEDLAPSLLLPARTQIEYLRERGHTRVFYAVAEDPSLGPLVQIRLAAAMQTAAENGMELIPLPEFSDAAHAKAILAEAMAAHPEVTAIAAYNDEHAVPPLFALHMLGVPVPERMALIGIDDLRIAEAVYPGLTSIRTNFDFEALEFEQMREAFLNGGSFAEYGVFSEAIHFSVIVRGTA